MQKQNSFKCSEVILVKMLFFKIIMKDYAKIIWIKKQIIQKYFKTTTDPDLKMEIKSFTH